MAKIVLALGGAMLTSFLSTLVVWFSMVHLVGEQQATTNYPTQMLGNALLGIAVSGAVVLYATSVSGVSLRSLSIQWSTHDTVFTGAMLLITIGMAAGAMLLFHRMGVHTLTLARPHWGIVALGLAGQVGVVHEELLFRWYILTRAPRRLGGWAVVVSAVLFMLMHIPFKGAGYMTVSWFLGGLVYGYLYLKSGSLLVTVLAHAVHNWTLDLLMYSRDGVSLVQFASTRLVGVEKVGFELALAVVLCWLTYAVYGRSSSFLTPSSRLAWWWTTRPDTVERYAKRLPA